MTESFRPATARFPPSRQVRGTKLNTIIEDSSETQDSDKPQNSGKDGQKAPTPQLKLKTAGLPPSARRMRLFSPLSAGSVSSCSDTDWQNQVKAFDDLYDATDDESELSDGYNVSDSSTRPTSLMTPSTRRESLTSPSTRKRYPSLAIPSTNIWPSLHGAPKSSPVPPTPPPKIPVSPAALSILARSVPAVHAPPSLDGSVSSDQISNISTPATPDLQSLPDTEWNSQEVHVHPDLDEGTHNASISDPEVTSDQSIEIPTDNGEDEWHQYIGDFPQIPNETTAIEIELARGDTPSDGGVFLPEDALATLRFIPLNGTPEPWSETSEHNDEMWQLEIPPDHHHSVDDATPASELSAYSFTGLSIPSPGGFFDSLGPRARHTWSFPRSYQPPSSATAESFYNLPFLRSDGEVVEQIIDFPQRSDDAQLTAIYVPKTAVRIPVENIRQESEASDSPISGGVHEISRPITSCDQDEHEENYAEELQKKAIASLDRTSVWLAAQASYLAALGETNPVNNFPSESEDQDNGEEEGAQSQPGHLVRKKSVRFTETVPNAPSSHPSVVASKDSIYWRGFRCIRSRSSIHDTFVHRDVRFDAVQSTRLGLTNIHASRLLGNYELILPERPAYHGPFSQAPRNSVIASVLAEKAQFSMVEKEQLVVSQISHSMWAMDALKYLNGGNLIFSPAARRLSGSRTGAKTSKIPKSRQFKVLDLGGHVTCEWAWHLAHDYPDVKVYTVYTDHQVVNQGIKGPLNHRHVKVPHLWKLPFPDQKFDVISTRSLPALLKTERPVGESLDEYDLCLQECRRCLKPGGYLEFLVMDAEISRAGPFASATSIEFSFNLSIRGYDPLPTKHFLGRLRKQGFLGIKRGCMFLPMGTEPMKPQAPRETPDPRVKSQIEGYEAVHGPVGSTADIASITGLLGGWIWEQWLLKLQMEMGRDRGKLLEGIGSVFDEGRKNGSGWTCLSGWAMKPKLKKQPNPQKKRAG